MKRTLIFALIFGTAVIALPAVETRAETGSTAVNLEQDWRYEQRRGRGRGRGRGNSYGRPRTYTTTRIVRRGWSTYRETIRVTRWPNGRTRSQVIRRVRIR
jgi:hypothetical protein